MDLQYRASALYVKSHLSRHEHCTIPYFLRLDIIIATLGPLFPDVRTLEIQATPQIPKEQQRK